ncbi:MAG: hypothetical protein P8M30_04745 [Planctomycetaceae bacterium]|nr:hypothetical protein [Planctomycetaceae bacterium]
MRKIALSFVFLCIMVTSLSAEELCKITVIDAQNGWPVPLVELKTTNNIRFYSDNAGVIAFDLPEMMGTLTWFSIEGHGYGVEPDGFGFRGVRVTPDAGKELIVKVNRKLPAKRLGRITGAGLFAESQRFGDDTDWKDQGIVGCDSVQNAVHHGKMYWLWGDTKLARYPLGLFDMLGATTDQKPITSFEPPLKLVYDYLTDENNHPRIVADMPGSGPTWLNAFISLPDRTGRQRLCATYTKIINQLSPYEMGLCVWNEETENLEQFKVLWEMSEDSPTPPVLPEGHVVRWSDERGHPWILFGDPFPRLKCHATFEAWSNPEAWTFLEPQKKVKTLDGENSINPHRGSMAWNEYRKKWVTVFTQFGGDSSILGELWYAEADSPFGSWKDAVKVVTHNNYSFYNPRLHPEFTAEKSPILLFEATYTATFADHAIPTPRHDYNQILYRLDLNDPKLIGD